MRLISPSQSLPVTFSALLLLFSIASFFSASIYALYISWYEEELLIQNQITDFLRCDAPLRTFIRNYIPGPGSYFIEDNTGGEVLIRNANCYQIEFNNNNNKTYNSISISRSNSVPYLIHNKENNSYRDSSTYHGILSSTENINIQPTSFIETKTEIKTSNDSPLNKTTNPIGFFKCPVVLKFNSSNPCIEYIKNTKLVDHPKCFCPITSGYIIRNEFSFYQKKQKQNTSNTELNPFISDKGSYDSYDSYPCPYPYPFMKVDESRLAAEFPDFCCFVGIKNLWPSYCEEHGNITKNNYEYKESHSQSNISKDVSITPLIKGDKNKNKNKKKVEVKVNGHVVNSQSSQSNRTKAKNDTIKDKNKNELKPGKSISRGISSPLIQKESKKINEREVHYFHVLPDSYDRENGVYNRIPTYYVMILQAVVLLWFTLCYFFPS